MSTSRLCWPRVGAGAKVSSSVSDILIGFPADLYLPLTGMLLLNDHLAVQYLRVGQGLGEVVDLGSGHLSVGKLLQPLLHRLGRECSLDDLLQSRFVLMPKVGRGEARVFRKIGESVHAGDDNGQVFVELLGRAAYLDVSAIAGLEGADGDVGLVAVAYGIREVAGNQEQLPYVGLQSDLDVQGG